MVLREAAWDVTVAGLPQGFNHRDQIPVFSTRVPIVGKFGAPPAATMTTVSLRGSSTQTLQISTQGGRKAYVAFGVAWPGANELAAGYDSETIVNFETAALPDVADLIAALSAVPSLVVQVGKNSYHPWRAPYSLPEAIANEDVPPITIRPDYDDLRLGLRWHGPESSGNEEGLTAEATSVRLRRLWGMDAEVRISAGALGTIVLLFRAPEKAVSPEIDTRVLRWSLRAAAGHDNRLGAWITRRSIAVDEAISRPAANPRQGRWMPLVIRTLKEPKN